jgi:ABC-type dipeptide/oligopeptide/nickel transport system ATPase component
MVNGDHYSWIKYIKGRIKRNKNFLCIISGPTGSGKSWSAMSIAEMLNDDFNTDRIIFRGKDLMREINTKKYDKRKGVVFIWDEAGVDLSSRNWQSVTNKMLNFLIQTFRHQNFILIFTAPYSDFLDVSTRKLFHAEFETVTINKNKQTVKIKAKQLQYNAGLKKWYKKYLKSIIKGKGVIKIKEWYVPKPSDELIDEYEERKKEFTAELNIDIESFLGNLNIDGKKKEGTTFRHKNINYCYHKLKIKSPMEIAKKVSELEGFKVFRSSISRSLAKMDKDFPKWRENSKEIGYSNTISEETTPSP